MDERGTVEAIWITDEGSAPMERRQRVQAVDGGLEGDRYCRGTGYYSGYDECQVTLIAGEAIDEIDAQFGIDLTDGRHRRNVVTRGLDLTDLLDHRFRIGDATLAGTRPRPPCAHVAQVAGDADLPEALRDGRGGICADVIDPGTIEVGDEIAVGERVSTDPDDVAAAIRDRYE
ncbi:MAG: MOSC domain-containing protein [Halapricum sp.]